jgi:hypothetical protein
VKSDDGKDSIQVEIPKDMPQNMRQQVEVSMKNKMLQRIPGDTTYFVKSENGLDSISLTIPKSLPENIRKQTEENTKKTMREIQERRTQRDKTITAPN